MGAYVDLDIDKEHSDYLRKTKRGGGIDMHAYGLQSKDYSRKNVVTGKSYSMHNSVSCGSSCLNNKNDNNTLSRKFNLSSEQQTSMFDLARKNVSIEKLSLVMQKTF